MSVSGRISLDEFFAREEDSDLLRMTMAGSVDDGKSTLIGRLLYESESVPVDHLAGVQSASKKLGKQAAREKSKIETVSIDLIPIEMLDDEPELSKFEKLITEKEYESFYDELQTLSKMCLGLINSVDKLKSSENSNNQIA